MNTNERDKITQETSIETIKILQEYMNKIANIHDYLELDDIMTNMIENLRENVIFTLISGEKMLVIENC